MNPNLENLLLEPTGHTTSSSGCLHGEGRHNRDSNPKPDKPRYRRGKTRAKSAVPLKKRQQPERGGKSRKDSDEEMGGDDSDNAPSIGSDLYKDEDDKAELEKKSQLQREMILAERSVLLDDYRLKKMAKARAEKGKRTNGGSSSRRGPCMRRDRSPPTPVMVARASVRRTSVRGVEKLVAAKSALQELRARRRRQQDPQGFRNHLKHLLGDGFAFHDRSPPVASRREVSPPSEGAMVESDEQRDDELPADSPLRNVELIRFEDIRDITIPRSRLLKWFIEPFFEDLLPGCFVRIGIYQHRDGSRKYRLYMVKHIDASDRTEAYNLQHYTTYKHLVLATNAEESFYKCRLTEVSDSPPLEIEFQEWLQLAKSNGMCVPAHSELLEKKEEIHKALNFVYSAETVKQLIQEKKSASLRLANMAAEKDRLRKDLEVVRACNDEAEVDRIITRVKQLKQMQLQLQLQQADSKAVKLVEMNRRNRIENFKAASEMKPRNTELKAGDEGYDPFSRHWTRPSRSFYSPKPAGEGSSSGANAGVACSDDGKVKERDGTAAGQEAKAPMDHAMSLQREMHSFDVKVDLMKMLNLGRNPEERVFKGNLMRRQRQERTIGRLVPETDGKSHPNAISIEEYRRRRGMT